MNEAGVVERPEAGVATTLPATRPVSPDLAETAVLLEPPEAGKTQQQRVFARGEFRYPALGDGKPGGGEPVTLLTLGGVSVSGCWQDDGRYVAWSPLPLRDRAKEQRLREMGKRI